MLHAVAIAVAGAAVWFDWRERRIPNRLVAVGMAAGLGLGLVTGGLRGLGASAAGLIVGGAILFVPFALGWVGAGDVKLLAAVGAILGPRGAALSMLYGAVAGGIMSAAVLMRRRRLGLTLAGIGIAFIGFLSYVAPGILGRSMRLARQSGQALLAPRSGVAIPYSVAIGLGLLVAMATGFSIVPA